MSTVNYGERGLGFGSIPGLRTNVKAVALAVILMMVAAVCAPGLAAQTGGDGAIVGTVADPTGAVVSGATVTATNVDTGVQTTRVSTSDGLYNISPLQPGVYTVEVKAPGFQSYKQQNLSVDALHVLGLNLTLKLGKATDEITVTDAPPQLETTNGTLGGTIRSDTYEDLPLMVSGNQQRDITQFSNLLPGAQLNPGGRSSVIGGTEQRLGEVYLDGMALTTISQTGDNRPIFNGVPMEAIEQIQVVTSGFPAEFQGAGLENYTLKSGKNQFHGTAADYIRNTIFDTWGFSAPWATITNAQGVKGFQNAVGSKPVDHQNELSVSIGGPVTIPHLYSGKDKLFFHATYDKVHSRAAPSYTSFTLPTTAMQGGDFSGLLTANGGPGYLIYDPTSQAKCTANSTNGTCRYQFGYGAGTTAGANGNPVLLPGGAANVVPTNEISPIAKNMQQFLPSATNSALSGNYIGGIPVGYDNQLWAVRVDYNLSPKQRLSAAFANGRRHVVPYASGTGTLPFPYQNTILSTVVTTFGDLEHTYTITPHLVNQLLLGYIYFGGPPSQNPSEGISTYEATTMGINGLPVGQASDEFPSSSFSGSNAPTGWGGSSAVTNKTSAHTYDIVDNLQWVVGKHSFTFGIQLQDLMENNSAANSASTPLTLTWSPNDTSNITGTAFTTNTGFAYASYLIGAVNANGSGSAAVQALSDIGQRFHPIAPYIQDDYKVTRNLTLNLGVRWDYLPGYRESQDRWSYLNATMTNPYTGNPGVLEFAGHYGGATASCGCRTPVNTYWKNWGPRLGFSYSVTPTTVLRGSASILYSHGGPTGGANSTTGTTGFTTPNTITANGAGPAAAPAFYLNNSAYFTANSISNTTFGGAAGVLTSPQAVSAASQALGVGNYVNSASAFVSAGAAAGYADPYYGDRTPTFYFFNLGGQQTITKDITLTVNYAGSVSHFLAGNSGLRGLQSGQVNPIYLPLGTLLTKPATAANIAAAQAIIPGCCTAPYAGFTAAAGTTAGSTQATIAQGLKWMPQYASTSDTWGLYTANAAYNALQVSIAVRPTHGLSFNVNYTWSKEMDDAGTIRSGYAIPGSLTLDGKSHPADRVDRALSTLDSPYNIAMFGVYKLPFGRGQIGGSHFLVRALASGWEFSDILIYTSGYPLTLSSSSCTSTSLPNQGTCMPDINPNFTGPIKTSAWGVGATATNLATKSYINNGYVANTTPGNGVNASGAAAPCGTSTGPFCNPSAYMIGDAPRTGAYGLRTPSNFRLTSGLRRTFPIYGTVKFILGVDCQNVTNRVTLGENAGNLSIPTGINSTTFGTLAFASADSRDFQFSGRISF